jgi:hypothetical protein
VTGPERVAAYVDRFNAAVVSGDWDRFTAGLTEEAEMVFANRPVGPFRGRAEIAAAYRAQPPDDTLLIHGIDSAGAVDTVAAAWSAGGRLTLVLSWRAEQVQRVEITFG